MKSVPSPLPNDTEKRIPIAEWCWAAGVALVWSLVLALFSPTVFQGLDFIRFCDPVIELFRSNILVGEMPWWNPYSSLGRPFAIDMQTATFYPTTYLYLVFNTSTAWVIASTLHGTLAILGFTRLMRWIGVARAGALIGGVLFLFSAPLLVRMQAGQVPYVYALCYLPLVILFSAQVALTPTWRNWAALALVWGLQLLCSHPQVSWLSALAGGAFVTGFLLQPPWGAALRGWFKAGIAIASACLAGMALMGFVVVPFAELAGQSDRAVPSLAFSSMFSMAAIHWWSLVVPQSSVFSINWEYNLHVGLIGLIGGVASLFRWRDRVARGIAVMIVLGLIISLGQATPLFAVLFKILPGVSYFRIPARAGVLVSLGLLMGMSRMCDLTQSSRHVRATVIIPGLLIAVAVTLHFLHRMASSPESARWLLGRLAIIAASICGWCVWLERSQNYKSSKSVLFPLALFAELIFTVVNLKTSPTNSIDFSAEQVVLTALHSHRLDRQIAPPRVALSPALLRENSGMIYRYATISGFESLSLGRVWDYLHQLCGIDPKHAFNTTPAGEIYSRAITFGSLSLNVILPENSSVMSVITSPDARAYVATHVTQVPNRDVAITRIKEGHPFHDDVLIEQDWAQSVHVEPSAHAGSATITRFTLNSLEIAVESSSPGILVVAEAWYPGWRASVDGRQTDCLPVNAWMRGVAIPAGRSTITMSYHQNGLVPGIALSLTALAILTWAARTRASFPA